MAFHFYQESPQELFSFPIPSLLEYIVAGPVSLHFLFFRQKAVFCNFFFGSITAPSFISFVALLPDLFFSVCEERRPILLLARLVLVRGSANPVSVFFDGVSFFF